MDGREWYEAIFSAYHNRLKRASLRVGGQQMPWEENGSTAVQCAAQHTDQGHGDWVLMLPSECYSVYANHPSVSLGKPFGRAVL